MAAAAKNKISEVADNICKIGEFDDAVYFAAICSCSSQDHSQQLSVEFDSDVNDVTLHVYSRITTCSLVNWEIQNNYCEALQEGNYWKAALTKALAILDGIWVRIKMTKKIWVDGYVSAENEFIFRDESAIDSYIGAISRAKKKIQSINRNER